MHWGGVWGEVGRNPLPEGRGEAGNLKQDWSLDSLHRLPSVNKCPQSTEGEVVADMLTFRDNSTFGKSASHQLHTVSGV